MLDKSANSEYVQLFTANILKCDVYVLTLNPTNLLSYLVLRDTHSYVLWPPAIQGPD